MCTMMKPLKGVKVVSTATHFPGPAAAEQLRKLGANVIKVEPTSGDFLFHHYPDWYAELHRGIKIVKLDLKQPDHQKKLYKLLSGASVLLTSQKPKSLAALGISFNQLKKKFAKLNCVGLVSASGADDDLPGHDLNFQASAGLISPPHLPRALVADQFASQKIVETVLSLKLIKSKKGQQIFVSIEEAAKLLSKPVDVGATLPSGLLGGAMPEYNLYKCLDGHIALCALEKRFRDILMRELGTQNLGYGTLETFFLQKTKQELQDWAKKNMLPVAIVKHA